MTHEDISGDLKWAEQTLQQQQGSAVRVERVTAVPARTGRLHRLEVAAAAGPAHFFLKRYTPAAAADWSEHAQHLRLLATVTSGDAALLPYAVAGVEPARQLMLAAETPGERAHPRHDQVRMWHGVGRWLARLHAIRPSAASTTRPRELAQYTEPRFRQWIERDPAQRDAGLKAVAAAFALADHLVEPVPLSLVHGDISSANIRVYGQSIGLIDFDDLRLDMTAVDVSQAELEIDNLANHWAAFKPRTSAASARAALREGYGLGYPEGPAFWLAHLRNLSVFLTTLAAQRRTGIRSRLTSGATYRRLIAELHRTLDAVDR